MEPLRRHLILGIELPEHRPVRIRIAAVDSPASEQPPLFGDVQRRFVCVIHAGSVIYPYPGKTCWGAPETSLAQRRSMPWATSRSRAARTTETPRSVISRTAS